MKSWELFPIKSRFCHIPCTILPNSMRNVQNQTYGDMNVFSNNQRLFLVVCPPPSRYECLDGDFIPGTQRLGIRGHPSVDYASTRLLDYQEVLSSEVKRYFFNRPEFKSGRIKISSSLELQSLSSRAGAATLVVVSLAFAYLLEERS